jgi:hypothetical protein
LIFRARAALPLSNSAFLNQDVELLQQGHSALPIACEP